MRAIEPAESGTLTLEGFTIGYEVFGDPAAPAVLLFPAWQIVHARVWKMQVPFLARAFRVVTLDTPGNGRGERTTDPRAAEYDRIVDQAVGLLGHLGIASARVAGFSRGCDYAIALAARYPERVERLALIAPGVSDDWQPPVNPGFWQERATWEGWEKRNLHYWRAHWDDWLTFFFAQIFNVPHSTRQIEESISWANETTPEVLAATIPNADLYPRMPASEAVQAIRCPVLIVHGVRDACDPITASEHLARVRPDWRFVRVAGGPHGLPTREPVLVNRELERFFGIEPAPRREWTRAGSRRARRALLVSSPIGLGHAQRDLAIARALRAQLPDLRIDWLAQPPVTAVLERAGETIHPASARLASESAHWESCAGEHRLHAFQAYRELDEILVANFMVFLDVVRETPYDLWIGDEAWDVDYFLHENPELKTAPYVFLTDFLGYLPVGASEREAALTADYNAEMLEQIARYPRVRDRALFIGDWEDIVPERFGPGLPEIGSWTREHFDAVGYVLPFDPADYADTRAVRARLGYDPNAPLVIAAAGGTAVGAHLLARVAAAWPLIARERPDACCAIVAGPRIDPAAIPRHAGLRVLPYVHDLYEHLAVADLGIVQGGLSTTMELALTRRPFLSIPLREHFEQQHHVTWRLARYHAGRQLTWEETAPDALAGHSLATLGADTSGYRPHQPGAADRAAARIAELL